MEEVSKAKYYIAVNAGGRYPLFENRPGLHGIFP